MKLLVIYGPPAAGKYTVAKAVAERTGYRLFHNHLTIDLLRTVLPFGTPAFHQLSQQIRLSVLEEAAKQDIEGVVFTFVYEKETDDAFIKQLVQRVESNGGEIVFVQIHCDREELLRRVGAASRSQFKKLRSKEGLLETLSQHDQVSPIGFVRSTRIDSTFLSSNETAERVIALVTA